MLYLLLIPFVHAIFHLTLFWVRPQIPYFVACAIIQDIQLLNVHSAPLGNQAMPSAPSLATMSTSETNDAMWFSDSRASVHMTLNKGPDNEGGSSSGYR